MPGTALERYTHRLLAPLRHRLLYRQFATATMIPRAAFLANLELAARMRHQPGHIVECGVWRGGMSAAIASLLGPQRSYHLFDSFAGLPPAEDVDGPAAAHWQADTHAPGYHDNCTATRAQAQATMQHSGAPHYQLHEGWFQDTLPQTHFPEPIALLRLDGDWFQSTLTCLTHLFPHVAVGGRIILDDYGTWEGCTKAVHHYLGSEHRPEAIQHHRGVAFIDKTQP
jgi:O-methyltransferase